MLICQRYAVSQINKKIELMLTGRAKAVYVRKLSVYSSHFVATFTVVPLFDALVRKFPRT